MGILLANFEVRVYSKQSDLSEDQAEAMGTLVNGVVGRLVTGSPGALRELETLMASSLITVTVTEV